MALFSNFRKETSERSDSSNWAKQLLKDKSGFYFDSIEGCNQNANDLVTHLFERARVDCDPSGTSIFDDIVHQILSLEGADVLQRKINFAKCFGLPLSYVLYCDENERVELLTISSLTEFKSERTFTSYREFANWISEIKGWTSNKAFREMQDLPYFDRRLREERTPWPTNIDCFICDTSNTPIGILEFQNAQRTGVANHCSNQFFLCKIVSKNQWGYVVYHDDIRRWTSQEILRVQSGLRFYIITWTAEENDFQLKEVEKITIPYFPRLEDGTPNWDIQNQYKAAMHNFANSNLGSRELAKVIADGFQTFNLSYTPVVMSQVINNPPLNSANRTFPYIYYKYKETIRGDREQLVELFTKLIAQ